MTTSPATYRRRRLLAGLATIVILMIGIGVPVALVLPVPEAKAAITATLGTTTPAAKVDFPDYGEAAVAADGIPGVLATSAQQGSLPMASITKIVTALVVLQQKPLADGEAGPSITFTDADVDILNQVLAQDGSSAPVEAGWKLSQRDVLTTMLLPSANNYAESLAIWAFGSQAKYLAAARNYLHAQGLTHTTVVDANGLSAKDVSTPSDVVALGRLAMASPTITSIVKLRSATVPNVGTIENTNTLLGTDAVDGIKTGTTGGANGANLLFTNTVQLGSRTLRLIGVILGAPSHDAIDQDAPVLLDSAKAGLHEVTLATAGQPIARYRTQWGTTATVQAAKTVRVLVWSAQHITADATIQPLRSGTAGQHVGTVVFTVGADAYQVPVTLRGALTEAPVWWRLTHPIRG